MKYSESRLGRIQAVRNATPRLFSLRLSSLFPLVYLFCALFAHAEAGSAITYDASGNEISQQPGISAAPVIAGQPGAQYIAPGGFGGFSITVNSFLPVTYQWQFNGVDIAGATGDSLLVENVSPSSTGTYTVVITNSFGSITSGAVQLYDTAYFVWQGGTGDFNDPQNWNLNSVPGSGDTAVINSGTFTVSGPATASYVTVNVPFIAPFNADLNLNITGDWTFNEPVTFISGYQFNVTGGGKACISHGLISGTASSIGINGDVSVAFTAPINPAVLAGLSLSGSAQTTFTSVSDPSEINVISVDGAGIATFPGLYSVVGIGQILANHGAEILFPNVASYAAPNDTDASWTADLSGKLVFPALTSITGPLRTQEFTPASLDITASQGAVINFPALTTITEPASMLTTSYGNDGVTLDADNSGQIDAPLLNTFDDFNTITAGGYTPASSLIATNSGVLSLLQLVAPVGIQININALSNPENFISFSGISSFELNSGTVAMTMSNVNNLTSISAEGTGTKLSFPNVTSFTAPNDTSVSWTAVYFAELDFPGLVSITGPLRTKEFAGATLDIRATQNAAINFASLTTITEPASMLSISYGNDGVTFDADDSGVIDAPLLNTFVDFNTVTAGDNGTVSLLYSDGSGTIILPSLSPAGILGVTLDGITLPQPVVSTPQITIATKAGANLVISQPSLTGKTYQLQQSNSLSPTNWQNTGPSQSGNGGVLEFLGPESGTQMFYRVMITPWP